jgi:homoserine O-acetyltransferase/O-succinyltransferase
MTNTSSQRIGDLFLYLELGGLLPNVGVARPRPIREQITSMLRADPNWNGSDCCATGGVVDTFTDLRENTLRSYGIEEDLKNAFPERALRDAEVRNMPRIWAEGFDANSLLALGGAMMRFDPRPKLASIRSKVLFVLSRTKTRISRWHLEEVGVDARYFGIDSEHGHLASGLDAAKWEPILKRFLSELQTAT